MSRAAGSGVAAGSPDLDGTPRGAGPDPADLRTVLPAAAAWAGALVGPPAGRWIVPGGVPASLALLGLVSLVVVAAAPVLAGSALWLPGSGPVRPARPALTVTVALCCLLAGCAAGAVRAAALAGGPVADLAGDRARVTVELVVTGDPVPRQGRAGRPPYAVVRGRVEHVAGRGVHVGVRSPVVVVGTDPAWLDAAVGERLAVAGTLAPADSGGPVAAVLRAWGPPEPRASGGPYTWLEPLRAGLRGAVGGLPPPPRGLVPALVVGDERGLTDDLRQDMRATGLTHLTAVSGANVAIVLGAVLALARRTGVRSYALPALGATAVLAFVVLARPQPSVVRAAVMGLVALAALGAGGRRRGTATLGTAVLVLVLADPWLARTPGFALSVLATAGILVLAPAWRDATTWLPRPAAEALAIPLAAQVACTPVLVWLADEISLASVPANLLAAPAVAPATVLGAAAAVVAPVLPWLAAALAWPAGLAAWWIVLVAEQGARLPGATTVWPAGPAGVGLALLVVVGAVLTVPVLVARRALTLVLAVLLAVVLTHPPSPGWPPTGWIAVLCAVGQGDAVVVRAGERAAVVVDAGPDPPAVRACLDGLGVAEVPTVLLSHFHADHVDGLAGVLDGRRVGEVVVTPLDEPAAQAERVRELARSAGVPVRVATAGQRARAGAVQWEVLWPRRLIGGEGSPPNNASLVVLAEVQGTRLLLTGDVEPAAQRALLGDPGGLRADVLKVPHHGSAAQEAAFLRAPGAALALVGVGADNTYGHPAEATLDLLESGGARVLRTDVDGSVAVVLRPGGLGVVSRGRPGARPSGGRAVPGGRRVRRWSRGTGVGAG